MSDNPYSPPKSALATGIVPDGPTGLGGWLILVLISLAITPIRLLAGVVRELLPIFVGGQWERLTTPHSVEYHPLWAPLILSEMVGNIVFAAAAVALLWLAFRKSQRFPRLFVLFLLLNLAFVVADAFFSNFIPAVAASQGTQSTSEIVRSLVAALVWVPYCLVSKRVRNTFVG